MFKLNCVGSSDYISIKTITERLTMLSTKSFYIKLIVVLLTCSSVVVFGQSVSEMKRAHMAKKNTVGNDRYQAQEIQKVGESDGRQDGYKQDGTTQLSDTGCFKNAVPVDPSFCKQ